MRSMLMPCVGEGLEERRGHAAVRLHADADDGQLGDVVVDGHLAAAELARARARAPCTAPVRVGLRHGEREVGHAVAADVLDDHVDDDVRVGQRAEDLRRGARLVGDVADDDLGLVLVHGDAADDDLFHVGDFFFHDGSWVVVER